MLWAVVICFVFFMETVVMVIPALPIYSGSSHKVYYGQAFNVFETVCEKNVYFFAHGKVLLILIPIDKFIVSTS